MVVFSADKYENKTDEWCTPRSVVRPISNAVGGFDLDPASGAEQSPHADATYTEDEDGLHQPWFGSVWCNPPYSDKDRWLKKAMDESDECDTIVMLLPVDTSTQWFHNYVTQSDAIVFVEGRISFDDGKLVMMAAGVPSAWIRADLKARHVTANTDNHR